jgi:Mn2+/Fe2+ NRAMP family transporter
VKVIAPGADRHHPHRRRLRGHGYFSRLGPGFVTGAADDDPSGIGTYSQVWTLWTVAWCAGIMVAWRRT